MPRSNRCLLRSTPGKLDHERSIIIRRRMPHHPIELGAVYQTEWGNDPLRVIAFDLEVTMYGAWYPHENAWSSDVHKAMAYYRLPTPLLLERSTYLRTEPYTDAEFKRHRPDLPLSVAKHPDLAWTPEPPPDVASIEEALDGKVHEGSAKSPSPALVTPAIMLEPFGPKGSQRRGVLVEASDGKAFTEAELLWHAWCIQAPFVRSPAQTKGIGIYRSGLQRGLPSYYVWGSTSRLGE